MQAFAVVGSQRVGVRRTPPTSPCAPWEYPARLNSAGQLRSQLEAFLGACELSCFPGTISREICSVKNKEKNFEKIGREGGSRGL